MNEKKKVIHKKWIVVKENKEIQGYPMEAGFLYSINKENGEVIDVFSVDEDMKITSFKKKEDGLIEKENPWLNFLKKHLVDAIWKNLASMRDAQLKETQRKKIFGYSETFDYGMSCGIVIARSFTEALKILEWESMGEGELELIPFEMGKHVINTYYE